MTPPRTTLIVMYQNRAARHARAAEEWRDGYLSSRWWRWFLSRPYCEGNARQFQTLAEIYALTARLLAGVEA